MDVQPSKGDKGDTGDKGDMGKVGPQGEPGPNGFKTWFSSREPFITFIFFIVLAILSFGTILSANQTNTYIKQRSVENKARQSCIVIAFAAVPLQDPTSNRDMIISSYNACVAKSEQ